MVTSMPSPEHGPRRVGPWPLATLLGSLNPETRERLLSLGALSVQVASGETLIMEGDRRSKHVFLITQGYVKVISNSVDGKARPWLAIRSDEDLIGELASLHGIPRLASVVTVGPCFANSTRQRASSSTSSPGTPTRRTRSTPAWRAARLATGTASSSARRRCRSAWRAC